MEEHTFESQRFETAISRAKEEELKLKEQLVHFQKVCLLNGRKEGNVYITTHSTHFIYGYMERKGNVLFHDALDTFYLRLHGVRHG